MSYLLLGYFARVFESQQGKLLRTPPTRTSQNNPSETVWKIGMGSEIGTQKATKRAPKALIGRSSPPKKYAREASGHFPNSFSTHLGE
jgi:hypothetical protein